MLCYILGTQVYSVMATWNFCSGVSGNGVTQLVLVEPRSSRGPFTATNVSTSCLAMASSVSMDSSVEMACVITSLIFPGSSAVSVASVASSASSKAGSLTWEKLGLTGRPLSTIALSRSCGSTFLLKWLSRESRDGDLQVDSDVTIDVGHGKCSTVDLVVGATEAGTACTVEVRGSSRLCSVHMFRLSSRAILT